MQLRWPQEWECLRKIRFSVKEEIAGSDKQRNSRYESAHSGLAQEQLMWVVLKATRVNDAVVLGPTGWNKSKSKAACLFL